MKIRLLDGETVRRHTPYDVLVPLMAETMAAVSAGQSELPLRCIMPLPGTPNRLGVMTGYLAPAAAAGVKIIGIVPDAVASGGSSHAGLMILFDARQLRPIAMLCGAMITARRTAAASAAATNVLARRSASTLAVLGTGEQAETHLEALLGIREISDIRIWGRRPAASEALARRARATSAARVEVCPSVSHAVDGADIICTTTAAATPILAGVEVARGAHVNLVGSSIRTSREVDDDLVRRSRFFVDYRPSALAQAGELLSAVEAGVVTLDHIAGEIGEVIAGRCSGRTSDDEITVYKSLGIAAQDIATARHVLGAAQASDEGTVVDWN